MGIRIGGAVVAVDGMGEEGDAVRTDVFRYRGGDADASPVPGIELTVRVRVMYFVLLSVWWIVVVALLPTPTGLPVPKPIEGAEPGIEVLLAQR